MRQLRLPVGIEDFAEIRRNEYYYVDKTQLIEQVLDRRNKVTLFTRPRRFGKTLNMSMLRYFFEIGTDVKLFEELFIAQNHELCEKYMGKYPVVSISLKSINADSYSKAKAQLIKLVNREGRRVQFLMDSDRLTAVDKALFTALLDREMEEDTLVSSLQELTELLEIHFGQQVIVLIDEYDVPLAKANQNGYYDEMALLLRNFFENVLKTNDSLEFAVLTGCLRIAKESIFTGTNNFVSDTISHSRLNEYFGFTENDVNTLLKKAHAEIHASQVKYWYDGYRFGDFDVYCPWDVMNYLRDLQINPQAHPSSYWKNTSDNAIIRSFIDYAGNTITKKLEKLLSGEYILQHIDENLTYDYLHSSEDNLWSILYLKGYLTRADNVQLSAPQTDGVYALKIPNAEIREIFETTVIKWFDDSARTWNRQALFQAVWNTDCSRITDEMTKLLRKTISYHDYLEDYYHAFLAGIFAGAGYIVESNKEHGEGRSDVVVYDTENSRVAVFEAKYSKSLEQMESDCDAALQQIEEKMYAREYEDEYDHILCYGIAFYKKRCLVKTI